MFDPLGPYIPLWLRFVAAGIFFGVLGLMDYLKNPTNPKRLKEYLFLISVTLVVVAYGILHDLITSALSPEYFAVGKGISSEAKGYILRIISFAIQASYSVGLIMGVCLLVANNPSAERPQLSYRVLFGVIRYPILMSLGGALIVASLFVFLGRGIETLDLNQLAHPKKFLLVWGIHHGTYAGATIGTIFSMYKIRKLRAKIN